MKLLYKPEIDGLRALAVLSVIVYHSDFIFHNIKILKGGFLGVDIFFTISGYLITSILLKEYSKNKKISLINFYERRIRRILPALLIVILTTSFLSILILLPESLYKFAKTILFSISFLTNMYFWKSQTVYGAEESFLSPLLHTWSLSVEEQFYIFYPVLIILTLTFFNRKFVLIIVTIFFFSIILSILGNYYVPSFNFFILPTRVWEFIAGGMISYYENKNKLLKKNNSYISLIGLIMIVFSILYFNNELDHPSLFTIIPVAGTCLIIYSLNFKSNIINKILSNKIFVNIGLISYSLYLWHFPLFSLSKNLGFYDYNEIKILIIFLTFLLSIISFKYIEKYFRNKKNNFFKVLLFIMFVSFILVSFSIKIIQENGYEKRLTKNLSQFQINFLNQKKDTPINLLNKNKKHEIKLDNVIVLGNSHGFDLYASLSNNKYFKKKYNFHLLQGQIQCLEESIKKRNKVCVRFLQFKHREQFKKRLENYYKSDVVIIKTRWSDNDVEKLNSLIKYIKNDNKKVIIFSSNPEFNFEKIHIKEFDFQNILKSILYKNSDYIDRFIIKNNRMPNNEELIQINKKYYNSLKMSIIKKDKMIKEISELNKVKYFDFKSLICNYEKNSCFDLTKSYKKIYTDQLGHLSSDASKYTANQIYQMNLIN